MERRSPTKNKRNLGGVRVMAPPVLLSGKPHVVRLVVREMASDRHRHDHHDVIDLQVTPSEAALSHNCPVIRRVSPMGQHRIDALRQLFKSDDATIP